MMNIPVRPELHSLVRLVDGSIVGYLGEAEGEQARIQRPNGATEIIDPALLGATVTTPYELMDAALRADHAPRRRLRVRREGNSHVAEVDLGPGGWRGEKRAKSREEALGQLVVEHAANLGVEVEND